jgi:hypothetical protein
MWRIVVHIAMAMAPKSTLQTHNKGHVKAKLPFKKHFIVYQSSDMSHGNDRL